MATVDPRAWAAPKPSIGRRLLPILTWLPTYERSFLRFDVIAGATVCCSCRHGQRATPAPR